VGCVDLCVCSLMWINWSRMVRQCSELQLRYRESSTATTHTSSSFTGTITHRWLGVKSSEVRGEIMFSHLRRWAWIPIPVQGRVRCQRGSPCSPLRPCSCLPPACLRCCFPQSRRMNRFLIVGFPVMVWG
jgi:hypothetical protein